VESVQHSHQHVGSNTLNLLQLAICARKLPAVDHFDVLLGLSALCPQIFDFSDDFLAIDDFARDYVSAVEMKCWDGCDKEMRPIGT
jgi:hypothetical protein